MSLVGRLAVTRHQALLMMDLGLDKLLGVDPSRSMLIMRADCETILGVVQRRGRTDMSLRRRVIAVRRELEGE